MKKLPEITVSEWLDAEKELVDRKGEIKPAGSVTCNEYGDLMKISSCHARKRLGDMVKEGMATSQRWRNGTHGCRMVYILKPKKDWPKK
jgi:hypothetical protein